MEEQIYARLEEISRHNKELKGVKVSDFSRIYSNETGVPEDFVRAHTYKWIIEYFSGISKDNILVVKSEEDVAAS